MTTIEAIVTEVCYVLRARAHYGLTPAEIGERLRPVLSVPGLKLPHKRTYLDALDLWRTTPSLDFEDVLLAAHAKEFGLSWVTSFDTAFEQPPGIVRREP